MGIRSDTPTWSRRCALQPASSNRYQPLPGVTKLPGWLLGRLSRRTRRRLGVATLLAAAALAIFLADLIATGNRQAAEERVRVAAAEKRERARLKEDQRPRRAALPAGVPVVGTLQEAVTRDARDRVRAGLLEGPIRGTACTPIGGSDGAYNCFSLNRQTTSTRTIATGYRFSAKVNSPAQTMAWCKRNPPPLHPDTDHFEELPVSADCLP